MNKKSFFLILILTIILSFSCKKNEESKIYRKGIVNFFEGTVYIITNNNKIKASVGAAVKQGMKIITGDNSFVDIYFGENVVKILSKSSFEIKTLLFDIENNAEHTEFFTSNGRIFSKIKKKLMGKDSYLVKSPSAVAGVRGTEFLLTEKNGKGAVSCLKGKVEVHYPGFSEEGRVEVKGGEEAQIGKDKKLSVRALSEANKGELKRILENIKEAREDTKNKFNEERDRIIKEVKDHKEAVRKMVKDQKEDTKKEIEKIKEEIKRSRNELRNDKEEIEKLKESVKEFKEKAKKDADEMKEEAKKKNEKMLEENKKLKEDIKSDMDSVKPDLKKSKENVE